jgi:orotidine-5'-phosphate decarboxylase
MSCGEEFFKSIHSLSLPYKILGVTALTSLSDQEVSEIYGNNMSAHALVQKFLSMAAPYNYPSGCICSGHEVTLAKSTMSKRSSPFTIICPGVRFSTANSHDQARVTHPFTTLRQGADFVVIGRELTLSTDPLNTWSEWKKAYAEFR